MSKTILAIDPSTVRIGWAALQMPLVPECAYQLEGIWQYGSWPVRGDSLQEKMHSVKPLLERFGYVCHLVVEKPTFFNSEAGRIAAREGHIINLSIMLGWIIAKLDLWGPDLTMYAPNQWKGMVPKDVTRKKFYRVFNDARRLDRWGDGEKYNHDTVDAIMLLHFWLTQRHLTQVK